MIIKRSRRIDLELDITPKEIDRRIGRESPKECRNALIEFLIRLDEEEFYRRAVSRANRIREEIIGEGKVAVRKTFRLHDPGCNVNCNYCTLGTQYGNDWNQDQLRKVEDLREEFSDYNSLLDEFGISDCNIELVGYWRGINGHNSEQLGDLLDIIEEGRDRYSIVGGDLGIVSEEVLEDLREQGLRYLHNNLETSRRLYPRAIGTGIERFERKVETLEAAHEQGLSITSGVLIGLGEQPKDLAEMVMNLRDLPLDRVAVNFMDYETVPEIGERFKEGKEQLDSQYALRALVFLRNILPEDTPLLVGSGTGRYFYAAGDETFSEMLDVVDTIHIGSFTNLRGSESAENLLNRLERKNHRIVLPPYFRDA